MSAEEVGLNQINRTLDLRMERLELQSYEHHLEINSHLESIAKSLEKLADCAGPNNTGSRTLSVNAYVKAC